MLSTTSQIGTMGGTTFKALTLAVAIAAWLPQYASAADPTTTREAAVNFDIPAGDLSVALEQFSTQSNFQAMYRRDLVGGKRTPGLKGDLAPAAALNKLLAGTGLTVEWINDRTFALKKSAKPEVKAPMPPAGQARSAPRDDQITALSAILVTGSRTLNADIERTEDDVQPYVVFHSEEIEGSMASNIEEFISARLPMNQTIGTASRDQPETAQGNRSKFNLRGLGANQTLILVNGRRAPGVSTLQTGDMDQPDINGIPLAAIERIEVLPATASGIYGGGATGGVINIVLKSDYQGGRVKLTYDNSFDTDTRRRRLDLSTGFSLFDGKTQIALFGSYSDANDLLVRDRDFAENGRRMAIENAPKLVFSNLFRINGAQTNFAALTPFLTLRDGTVLDSQIGTVPAGYAGLSSDGGLGLLGGLGTFNTEIPNDISGGAQGLSTVPKTYSGYASIKHNFTDRIDAYLDIGQTTNQSVTQWSGYGGSVNMSRTDLGNPFNNSIAVYYNLPGIATPNLSTSKTSRLNGGLVYRVSKDWTAGLDVNWNQSENSTSSSAVRYDTRAINTAIRTGAIDIFRDMSLFPYDLSQYYLTSKSVYGPAKGEMNEVSARVSGTIAKTAAGNATLTAILSQRRDGAAATFQGTGPYRYLPSRHQEISSAYVEAAFPLVADSQGVPFVNQFDVQASVRRDAYETESVPAAQTLSVASLQDPIPPFEYSSANFSSNDYTLGFRYRPISSVTLRGSVGTGFLPPSLAQIAGIAYETRLSITDPMRGGQYGLSGPMAVTFAGGNSELKPEQSKSTSLGFIYSPESMDQFRLSLDYTRIEKKDEITTISFQEIINMEELFPGRVTRGDRNSGDPADWAGQITAIDASAVNISESNVEAFDLQFDKEWWTGKWGKFHVYGVVSYQSSLDRKLLPQSDLQNRVGYSDGVLRWRGNFGGNWTKGPLRVSVNTSYYDSYKVFSSYDDPLSAEYKIVLQGSETIPSQSYTDVSMSYKFQTGWLADSSLNFGVRNIFNQKPPTVATVDTRGGYSTYGDPRLSTYVLSFEHNF